MANAALAFAAHRRCLRSERWQTLAAAGARPQRPLWASTGTKNPAYPDVLYVEALIARGVVNTMPKATLDSFADHGTTSKSLITAADAATDLLDQVHRAGVDLGRITDELEREGVQSFCASYAQLLACIEERAAASGTPVT